MILTSNYRLVVGGWLLPIIDTIIADYRARFIGALLQVERERFFWSRRN
jgi:hypothetical protein